jgi:hypothetical protein
MFGLKVGAPAAEPWERGPVSQMVRLANAFAPAATRALPFKCRLALAGLGEAASAALLIDSPEHSA